MPALKPYSLANTFTNPLARMFPFFKPQKMVYRLGEKTPPAGGMVDHAPVWEAVSAQLAAQDTIQLRVNVQRDFWLLGLTASSDQNAGFRAQMYDTIKKVRLADRGVKSQNIAGGSAGVTLLRDPYHFDQPDSQILVILQNLATVQANIQLVLYGQVLRFNQ